MTLTKFIIDSLILSMSLILVIFMLLEIEQYIHEETKEPVKISNCIEVIEKDCDCTNCKG